MPELASYWAQVHTESDRGALSGCSLATHNAMLGTGGMCVPGAAILCIGVGTGSWVQELAARGCRTSALDICGEALARVSAFAQGYLSPAALPACEFDLAMSHWVSPHMPADALAEQINGVVRSLLPTGVFALHFNEPTGDDPRAYGDEFGRMVAGSSLYTREQIGQMVKAAGAASVEYVTTWPDQQWRRNHVAAHIRR
jgi:hypothetical protein